MKEAEHTTAIEGHIVLGITKTKKSNPSKYGIMLYDLYLISIIPTLDIYQLRNCLT
jgi:hypothetical protein